MADLTNRPHDAKVNAPLPFAAIVLAAGLGRRMRSSLPKVMHRAAGRTLIGHVLTTLSAVGPSPAIVVIGPGEDAVAEETRRFMPDALTVIQSERKGTGHAAMVATPLLQAFNGRVLILFGDCPNVSPHALRGLLDLVISKTPMAVLGFKAADPYGYGRFIQDKKGNLIDIREELDASRSERKIDLCNSGIMAIDANLLRKLIASLDNRNAKGEYYLSDLVSLARREKARIAHAVCPEAEVAGVNTRAQLAEIEMAMQKALRSRAMEEGATLTAPETVFLSADTKLGRDIIIEPNVVIGPGVEIADNVTIRSFCHLEGASISRGAIVGPFARLRPGARIGEHAHIGNFVEIKNAAVESGAKVNHLSYVGDARVGEKANIGAGTITCNYDGIAKYFTDIGAGAFIGSNSALVAPVKIGDGAYVGSGSVIDRDVEQDSLALERAQMVVKPGWAARFRAVHKKRKSATG
ncbi:MAG: bifunctional UDP-N-acetylglucosamine diphosphorylase/glucosamine-1-phosphate N-acetyltransferase GlmU [Aestuariivirgaceae bacterium]